MRRSPAVVRQARIVQWDVSKVPRLTIGSRAGGQRGGPTAPRRARRCERRCRQALHIAADTAAREGPDRSIRSVPTLRAVRPVSVRLRCRPASRMRSEAVGPARHPRSTASWIQLTMRPMTMNRSSQMTAPPWSRPRLTVRGSTYGRWRRHRAVVEESASAEEAAPDNDAAAGDRDRAVDVRHEGRRHQSHTRRRDVPTRHGHSSGRPPVWSGGSRIHDGGGGEEGGDPGMRRITRRGSGT